MSVPGWGQFFGFLGKLADRWTDPALSIQRQLDDLDKEWKFVTSLTSTPARQRRAADILHRMSELRDKRAKLKS